MDNSQPSATPLTPAQEPEKPTSSPLSRLNDAWRRVEAFYRDWRLLCTIVFALAGTGATAVAAIARGLDTLTIAVLGIGIGVFVWLSWDAAGRTRSWLPPVAAFATVVIMLAVAAAADWRASVLQLFSDSPRVSLSDVEAKDKTIATWREHVSTLDAEVRRLTQERDAAVAAMRSPDSRIVARDPRTLGTGADLMQFFDAYALPAKKHLLPLLNISSGDSDLDVALDTFLPRALNSTEAGVVAQFHPDVFNGNVQSFCDFFAAYQETVRWFYKLTDRTPNGDWCSTGNRSGPAFWYSPLSDGPALVGEDIAVNQEQQ